MWLFEKPAECQAFQRVLRDAIGPAFCSPILPISDLFRSQQFPLDGDLILGLQPGKTMQDGLAAEFGQAAVIRSVPQQ